MKHDFWDTASHEHLDGGVIAWAIRERINQPRGAAVNALPVLHGGWFEASSVGNRRDVQEKVSRSAKSRVDEHRIFQGLVRQDG